MKFEWYFDNTAMSQKFQHYVTKVFLEFSSVSISDSKRNLFVAPKENVSCTDVKRKYVFDVFSGFSTRF